MLKRIITPLLLVGCLWLISSSVTTYYIGRLEESYERSNAEDLTTILSASSMVGRLWSLHSAALMSDVDLGKVPHEELNQRITDFEGALAESEATCFTEPEKACAASIHRLFRQYREHLDRLLNSAGHGKPSRMTPDDPMIQLANQIWAECKNLRSLNKQQLDDATVARARFIKSLNLARHASAIVGLLIGGLLGFWIARGLHQSVSQISITLREAVGELEHEVGQVLVARPTDLPALEKQVQTVALQIKHVVDKLAQARYQVAATERLALAGELATGVAHEIRNPLTSVKLLIQMAARRSSPHHLDERQLQVIQDEIGRMEKTIQGLLDFARPPQLHRVAHDLRETGRRALDLLCGLSKQRNVTIAESFHCRPVMVDGDPALLQQVIVNLLINSMESMPRDGRVEFAIGIDGPQGDNCRITVSDSGDGIAPDILERIFNPFVTTKESGTGLGLAISRRIVEEHGGTIQAGNRPAGGAKFTVCLPLAGDGTSATEDLNREDEGHARHVDVAGN